MLLRPQRRATKMASTTSVIAAPAQPALRAVTKTELEAATGEGDAQLYLAVKDPFGSRIVVFDVSEGQGFYGPGGPYHLFAGRHATHGLAKSSTNPAYIEGDLNSLSASERDTHMQWFSKYMSKYPQVGWLVEDEDAVSTITTEESKKDA